MYVYPRPQAHSKFVINVSACNIEKLGMGLGDEAMYICMYVLGIVERIGTLYWIIFIVYKGELSWLVYM